MVRLHEGVEARCDVVKEVVARSHLFRLYVDLCANVGIYRDIADIRIYAVRINEFVMISRYV